MSKKPKDTEPRMAHNIPLGPERHARIRRFCNEVENAGGKRPTIPEAVNMLIDRALELTSVDVATT